MEENEVPATKVNIFRIIYTNKSGVYIQTDAQTVEDQTNRTFGMTVDQAVEFGVIVEMMPEDFEFPADCNIPAPEEEHWGDDGEPLPGNPLLNVNNGTPAPAPAPAATPVPPVEPPALAPVPPSAPWAQTPPPEDSSNGNTSS